jgi:hypothetical protein
MSRNGAEPRQCIPSLLGRGFVFWYRRDWAIGLPRPHRVLMPLKRLSLCDETPTLRSEVVVGYFLRAPLRLSLALLR